MCVCARMRFDTHTHPVHCSSETRHARRRELLLKCVTLLEEVAAAGGAAHLPIRAAVHRDLAESFVGAAQAGEAASPRAAASSAGSENGQAGGGGSKRGKGRRGR